MDGIYHTREHRADLLGNDVAPISERSELIKNQYLTKRPCSLGLKPQFHPDR